MTFGILFTLFATIIVGCVALGGLISLLVDFARYLWRL